MSDPAPLLDLVTGFPPDDAIDVTVPIPLSLAIYMAMLESTGHAAELATLRKLHIEQARETVRRIQAGAVALFGPDLPASARLRITHIVEERVRPVPGLRPHLHVFIGATARCPDGPDGRVDAEKLASWADTDLLPTTATGSSPPPPSAAAWCGGQRRGHRARSSNLRGWWNGPLNCGTTSSPPPARGRGARS
jgi:hypothetical protein